MATTSAVAILLVLLFSSSSVDCAGAPAPEHTTEEVGYWNVTDPVTGLTCIRMQAALVLNLDYRLKDGTFKTSADIVVPAKSVVMNESGCQLTHDYHDMQIPIQILKLDMDHGWTISFAFSTDPKLGAPYQQDYMVLYAIEVHADYHQMHDLFPNSDDATHVYKRDMQVNNDDSSWELTQEINAAPQYSFSCPSKQTYLFTNEHTDDSENNLKGHITFSKMRLQAFAAASDDFMQEQTCPADQHANDLVPVIVGGVLAGLIVLTLVVYLIYRSRLPPDTLHLTNPNSHFDRTASTYDNKLHVADGESDLSGDDDEESPRSQTLNGGAGHGHAPSKHH